MEGPWAGGVIAGAVVGKGQAAKAGMADAADRKDGDDQTREE
jgi:hypothetical protein